MRKVVQLSLPAGILLFLILLLIYKNELTEIASRSVKSTADFAVVDKVTAVIDSAYNYSENGQFFLCTFLEFGATGCSACKRMESVMNEIKLKYPEKVKVEFINVLLPENENLLLYFGIVSIPTQVLLDKEGKEFFRHTGVISEKALIKRFNLPVVRLN